MTNRQPSSVFKYVKILGENDCWPWIGHWKSSNGYGRLDINGEQGIYANRAAYLSANPGSITLKAPADKSQSIMHTCDNPSCCNPRHLMLGTHRDNMLDKKKKGRCPDFKGEKGPRSKLTREQTEEIKWIASKGIAASESACIYGVHKSTIQGVLSGRHYSTQ